MYLPSKGLVLRDDRFKLLKKEKSCCFLLRNEHMNTKTWVFMIKICKSFMKYTEPSSQYSNLVFLEVHLQVLLWKSICKSFMKFTEHHVINVCRECACGCNIKKLKGRFISHKFSTGWTMGVVKSVEKEKSVAGQFTVKYNPETYCWLKN